MDDVRKQMDRILEEYGREVTEKVDRFAKEAADSTRAELKRTSPRTSGGGKHYANGWAVKSTKVPGGGHEYEVYNKAKPGLTHLLERSHVVRNQKGTYGRSIPQKHIEPAERMGARLFVEKCEREL